MNIGKLINIQHALEISLIHAKADLKLAEDQHDDFLEFHIENLEKAIADVEKAREDETPILDAIVESFEHITI